MTKVLVLGAAGRIARLATREFLTDTDADLTLYLRNPRRLRITDPAREHVVNGDVTDAPTLRRALEGQDVVYANLAGRDIEEQARDVVAAMDSTGVRRLIWISTLGIYDEVPGAFGRWNHEQLDGGYLETYAAAAGVIEASDLDWTIIRPAWLTDTDEVDYETTRKGEPFRGTEVSRRSVADLVVHLATGRVPGSRESLGVDKPGTEGDRPAWY